MLRHIAYKKGLVTVEQIVQYNGYTEQHIERLIGCGGFAVCENDTVVLAWGLIDNNYQKRGFGEALILHRINVIKSYYPNHSIKIDTSQYSSGFFEKYGFVTTGITKDHYAIRLDRYDMILKDY